MRRRRKALSYENLEKNLGTLYANNRFFRECQLEAPIVKRANGSKLYAYDGRVFIDLCLGEGRLILGHAHKNVILAVKKYAERGFGCLYPTKEEGDLISFLKEKIDCAHEVRFLSSENEALRMAAKAATLVTQKKKIVVVGTGYSGLCLEDSFDVLRCEDFDVDLFEKVMKDHGAEVACILLEPVPTRMGSVGLRRECKAIAEIAKKRGALVMVDEITAGFRVPSIFAYSELEIIPDIICLGKILGGGFSMGAICGRPDIVATLDSEVSFMRNPVVFKAGLATCRMITKHFINVLAEKSSDLAEGLNQIATGMESSVRFESYGAMLQVHLEGMTYNELFAKLFQKGILIPMISKSPMYLSCMHSKKDMSDVLSSFKTVL